MDEFRIDPRGKPMTTEHGMLISDDQNTLQVGHPGPILHEDFVFTEKIAHFNRERIPERVVHARGTGAHGFFRVYRSLKDITKASFLQDPTKETPVFVRFSTSQGFRGSADTARDVRGFATKFYTDEGNYDLVSNDTPIFWIQDPIKFPDFIHALKPEPHNEIPQAQTAHDTFWDYISLQPETLHNVMWAMSDRGIPRSYRTMEGFGVHTFRLVNSAGKVHFVRFHWKPVQGKASLIWDEAQIIMGRDPDFHRRDLWQAIEAGDYPEYELGLQIIPEEDEHKFPFDILDATKLIPESLVPVQYVGRMTLNRNPDNFFSETEQVAFCPANIVPGIDFSDDPLLQGRLFFYGDAQRHRLGTPNFHQLPINRPLTSVQSQRRDGFFATAIPVGANYEPNSISENYPRETPPSPHPHGGFATIREKLEGIKSRNRSASFGDYYTQPRLFFLSQTVPEQKHIINAFTFELSKVARPYIRERIVDHLTRIDPTLATQVASNLGIRMTEEQKNRRPFSLTPYNLTSGDQALSLYRNNTAGLRSRRVNVLIGDGADEEVLQTITASLKSVGVHPMWLASHMGNITTSSGSLFPVLETFNSHPSVLVDGLIVADCGKEGTNTLVADGDAKRQVLEAYKHLKPIAVIGKAQNILEAVGLDGEFVDEGIAQGNTQNTKDVIVSFLTALRKHRVWNREDKIHVIPA